MGMQFDEMEVRAWGRSRRLRYRLRTWAGALQAAVGGSWPTDRVMAAHEYAISNYVPRPYAGPVVLFRVRTMLLFRAGDPLMGWDRLAQGGVEVRIVPGAHYNILEPPHVAMLAAYLRETLAGGPAAHAAAPGKVRPT
jgi:hypothetical protein